MSSALTKLEMASMTLRTNIRMRPDEIGLRKQLSIGWMAIQSSPRAALFSTKSAKIFFTKNSRSKNTSCRARKDFRTGEEGGAIPVFWNSANISRRDFRQTNSRESIARSISTEVYLTCGLFKLHYGARTRLS